jgi:hypothetical protein
MINNGTVTFVCNIVVVIHYKKILCGMLCLGIEPGVSDSAGEQHPAV